MRFGHRDIIWVDDVVFGHSPSHLDLSGLHEGSSYEIVDSGVFDDVEQVVFLAEPLSGLLVDAVLFDRLLVFAATPAESLPQKDEEEGSIAVFKWLSLIGQFLSHFCSLCRGINLTEITV